MDYSGIFTYMHSEIVLIAVIVIAFLYDLFATGERARKAFHPLMCVLMAVVAVVSLWPWPS